MNFRNPLYALAFVAMSAPLAAYADAPSGDFYEIFVKPAASQEQKPASKAERAENKNYAEFPVEQLVAQSNGSSVTREELRKQIASAPLPMIGA